MEGRGGKGKRGERVEISDRINRRRKGEVSIHIETVFPSSCPVGMFTVNYVLYIHTCTYVGILIFISTFILPL